MSAAYDPFRREPPIFGTLFNAKAIQMKNLLLAAALAIFELGVFAVFVVAHTDFAEGSYDVVA